MGQGHLADVVVGDLAAEGDEGKYVEGDNGTSGDRACSVILALAAVPGNCSEHGDRNRVSSHAHVEDQLRGVEVIEHQQTNDAQDEGDQGEGIEKIGFDATTDPHQRPGFDEPSDGNPVGVEANRNG